jgi:Xaa-Pro dipeptidase
MQTPDEFQTRIVKAQQAMKEFGLGAIVLEPGPAMTYLTGVRWGKSERSFILVIPAKGEPAFVLPGFEEMRARTDSAGHRHPHLAGR